MDLVDEQHRADVGPAQLGGFVDHPPQVGHARGDRAQGHEVGAGDAGDDLGQRGLARPGRAPQDDRAQLVALDGHPQHAAWPDDVLLADEVVQGPRPQAGGEGLAANRAFLVEHAALHP